MDPMVTVATTHSICKQMVCPIKLYGWTLNLEFHTIFMGHELLLFFDFSSTISKCTQAMQDQVVGWPPAPGHEKAKKGMKLVTNISMCIW